MNCLKRWARNLAAGILSWTQPSRDLKAENQALAARLNEIAADEIATQERRREDYLERIGELIEARTLCGTGPWKASEQTLKRTDELIGAALEALNGKPGAGIAVKEAGNPILSQGAYGDIELALQNVEWRREINLSWLEFSRWGIQQIILISRLYYIKNPLIQRGINVCSYYVFGRGFELSSSDPDANDVIQDMLQANQVTLGQTACAELQKRLQYDGNVFFALFADRNKGTLQVRTIDATEIQEIITNPDDTDEPWLYKREWTQRHFNMETGSLSTTAGKEWYPALGYDPAVKPDLIGQLKVNWNVPLIHMKGGTGVSKWHFDVPKIYAALDWAREARRFLEACCTIRQALARVAIKITTKGGQQAMQGMKSQLSTSVGPSSYLFDSNPPPVTGSIVASGPGTQVEAFKTAGAGNNMDDVRQLKLMVAMTLDIPESFLADMNTSNLATAIALDRPTELGFIDKQERFREVLVKIAKCALEVSNAAPQGKLREAMERRKHNAKDVRIFEAYRKKGQDGRMVYEAKKPAKDSDVDVKATFPAIREGDLPSLVKAISEAMTLDNKGGQIVGIDEKEGVRLLFEQFGVDNVEDILEKMYPSTGKDKYDPNRTTEPLPDPIHKAEPTPGGQPQLPGGDIQPVKDMTKAAEALIEGLRRLRGKRAAA